MRMSVLDHHFRRYISSWPRSFLLVSFKKTEQNKKKKKEKMKKENYQKNQVVKMNKTKQT